MAITPSILAPQAAVFAAYSYPTSFVYAAQASAFSTIRQISKIEASQATLMAAVRGRIADPRLRAWTFTLDGHDFYVLRLGTDTTLLYDAYAQQWVEWISNDLSFWRPNTGISWIGAGGLPEAYGSNIVVGDDTFGLLWFLDPTLPYDQNPGVDISPQQIPFERIVTGQVVGKGRQWDPCYAVFLDGDNYGLTAENFTPSVTLETSDDQGRTFDAHDTLMVTPDYSQDNPYSWYSLGQISSPGRIFRVRDNGVFMRIDSMSMNDE